MFSMTIPKMRACVRVHICTYVYTDVFSCVGFYFFACLSR